MFIENWEWFSLNTRTPKPMDNLLKEIDNLVRVEKDKKKKIQLTELARRIRYKWCEAAFKYAYYYEVGKAGNDVGEKIQKDNFSKNRDFSPKKRPNVHLI
jgi:hypothetical protein